jgi:hypothetical protein
MKIEEVIYLVLNNPINVEISEDGHLLTETYKLARLLHAYR